MGRRRGLTSPNASGRWADVPAPPNAVAKGPGDSWRWTRLLSMAFIPVVVMLAARLWLVEPLIVSSDSMEPTIASGAVVFLFKPGVATGGLESGVVVAFASPVDGRTVIKRVVAQEGQSVAIRDAELYVDGVAVPEPFVDHGRIDATYFGPQKVPPGSVFVLGDNRGVSIDSRDFGAVPVKAIQGILLTGQTRG
ncbi:signal peptidase I [Paenarthrobacter nitroguajacolicus]